MTFTVEIALAKARKDDSETQTKDKQDLLHALTDKNIFIKILEQGAEVLENNEYLKENYPGQDKEYIVDYFMRIKDKVRMEELRFY